MWWIDLWTGFLNFFLQFPIFKYVALVPVALVEGPIISMASGLLVRGGVLNPFLAWLALACGEIIGDVIWYVVGYKWGDRFTRRFGRWFGLTPEHIEGAKALFARYQTPILFFTKISTGLGFAIPILFVAGLSRMPFRWFMILCVCGQFIWTALLLAVGYFLGDLYVRIDHVAGRVTIVIFIALIIVGVLLMMRQVRARLLEEKK